MPLGFVLDEQLRGGPLWRAIQQHNGQGVNVLDVVRVGDPPDLPLGSTDPAILLWAERVGRLLVSLDHQTMPGHLAHHLQGGQHSPGVLLVRIHALLNEVVEDLVLVAHAGDPALFRDCLRYLPL